MLNQIFNEDCLEWMKRIPDWSIDCIITDPPYWSTACRWDHVIPFEPMWKELKRIIKPNGAIVLFWSEPFSSALRMSNIKMYKYDWKWEKHKPSNFALAKKQPMKYYEDIIVFYKKQPTYNPQMQKRESERIKQWQKVDYIKTSINKWELNSLKTVSKSFNEYDANLKLPSMNLKINAVQSNSKEKVWHPTQKPVALIEYLIRTYTNEWETVLDFTIGSWTTAIACINTNRNYIGFELDKWYFDIANERIAWKLQNKK